MLEFACDIEGDVEDVEALGGIAAVDDESTSGSTSGWNAPETVGELDEPPAGELVGVQVVDAGAVGAEDDNLASGDHVGPSPVPGPRGSCSMFPSRS